jgi:regulator of replication initiation timing
MSIEKLKAPVCVETEKVLTPDELVELAEKVTNLDSDIMKLEAEMVPLQKEIKSIKEQISELDSLRKENSKIYKRGTITVFNNCDLVENFDTGYIEYVDIDSGEVVKQEKMVGLYAVNQ